MREVVVTIGCTVEACWRALTDATLLAAWLPGVRRVDVVSRDERGLATEVQFEYAGSRSYSLLYTYDHARREMRWEPRVGKRDAVRGFASVEADGDGTRLHYALEEGGPRREGDGDPAAIVAAFVAWVTSGRSK